jgi:uncharacterized membrane protein YesL
MLRYNEDSKSAAFIGRLADVFLLNLLWLTFSLPIVTIGASTVAACAVCMRLAGGEDAPIAAGFLKAFKENLRQGSFLWLFSAVALYALYLDWQLVLGPEDPPVFLIVAGIVSTVLAFCAFVYAYPLVARYRNSLRNDLGNSFRICFRHPAKTLLLVLVLVLEAAIFSWNSTMVLVGIAVGPMILIYTVSGVSLSIFKDIEAAAAPRAEPAGAAAEGEGDGKEPRS